MKIARSLALCLFVLISTFSARAEDEPNLLLEIYSKIGSALAADDLVAAKKTAEELASAASDLPDVSSLAGQVAKSESLAQAREHFKSLSLLAIPWAHEVDGYYVMTCPMAKADWVQKEPEVANPYYGKSMLRCGSLKK